MRLRLPSQRSRRGLLLRAALSAGFAIACVAGCAKKNDMTDIYSSHGNGSTLTIQCGRTADPNPYFPSPSIYSPRFVCWIEDANGKFVKTVYRAFSASKPFTDNGNPANCSTGPYSYTSPQWYAKSGGEPNGITHATPSYSASPRNDTFVWDLTNYLGIPVANGLYYYKMEVSGYLYFSCSFGGIYPIPPSYGSILIDGSPRTSAATSVDGTAVTSLSATYAP